jgi:hypothetical protein
MATRKERLKKLASVQEQLKAFHEMRYASFRAQAGAAETEAEELRTSFDRQDAMSALFPEIYHRRIERALERAARNFHLAATGEASEIAARFDADDSLAGMFPEIYHRRIGSALAREEKNRDLAEAEAARLATATARTNMVERAYRDVRREEERTQADRERLEMITRGLGKKPG